jgi:hypothetical protein
MTGNKLYFLCEGGFAMKAQKCGELIGPGAADQGAFQ